MNEYVIYLIISCVVIALASFATYDGERTEWGGFTLGIILFSFAISPILSGEIDLIPENIYIDTGSHADTSAEKIAEEAYCLGIKRAVSEKYSLAESEIEVIAYGFVFAEVRAETVEITLSGKAAFGDVIGIKNYVREVCFADCEVNVEFG